MQSRFDKFCEDIALPTYDAGKAEEFFSTDMEEKFDVNARHIKTGLRPIEIIAQSGSVSTFIFLIEKQNASVKVDINRPTGNLMELASRSTSDKDIKQYINANRLWNQFEDGTIELHAMACVGNTSFVNQALEKNIDVLGHQNLRHQNVLYWAFLSRDSELLELTLRFADTYIIALFKANNYAKIHEQYTCLAVSLVARDRLEDACESYVQALRAYKKIPPQSEIEIQSSAAGNNREKVNTDTVNSLRRAIADTNNKLGVRTIEELKKLDLSAYSSQLIEEKYKAPIDYFANAIHQLESIEDRTPRDTICLIEYPAHQAAVLLALADTLLNQASARVPAANNQRAATGNAYKLRATEYQAAESAYQMALPLLKSVNNQKANIQDFPATLTGTIENYLGQMSIIGLSLKTNAHFLRANIARAQFLSTPLTVSPAPQNSFLTTSEGSSLTAPRSTSLPSLRPTNLSIFYSPISAPSVNIVRANRSTLTNK
jgi:hypothetical protein